jgi:hypothetical protein
VNFSGFYGSLSYFYLPNKKKGAKKDVKKATMNNPNIPNKIDPHFAPGHFRIVIPSGEGSTIKIAIPCVQTPRSKIVNTEHDIDEGAGSKTERAERK